MNKAKTLTWNDRIALIEHYKPDDNTICQVFGVTPNELVAARHMEGNGTLVPTPNIDYASYKHLFVTATSSTKDVPKESSATSVKVEPGGKPETATKKSKTPQKRGRKGDKITKAFEAIPEIPVDAETFAETHSVSLAVLRQSKRFDKTNINGSVKVKKDKESGKLMIWREALNEE